MKLGDNMAPVEACNVWNDVCPRKARPPKIGDIPRHVAVDEESPGSSTSRSLVQVQEAAVKTAVKSMLVRSTGRHIEHGISNPSSGTLPALETFTKQPSDAAKKVERVARIPEELGSNRAELHERPSIVDPSILHGKNLNGSCKILNEISTSVTWDNSEKLNRLRKNSCVKTFESIIQTDENIDDDEITKNIIESRKDSALYIDEDDNDIAELRDRLVAIGVGPRSAATISHHNNSEDVVSSSRLSGPRPRRESSGYFSNLGTFDEDRWNCGTVDHLGNQQDSNLSIRESFRERRRSSTKNRLPMGGGQQINRMTTIVCPANDEEIMSTSENDVDLVGKTIRVDMPNIDEQSSLELNKSIEIVPSARIIIADVKCNERDETFEPISMGNSSSTTTAMTSKDSTAIETIKKISNCSIDENDSEIVRSDSVDCGSTLITNSRTAHRQRNRVIVHQYSSTNNANTELEKIVEKPHGETLEKLAIDFENSSISENYETKILREDCDDDDNERVVVDNLGGKDGSSENATNARKLLPKSIKVYQLLSTQSEDRGDGDARLYDRRISLQIPRPEEPDALRDNACGNSQPSDCRTLSSEYSEDKKLIHADSVPIIKIPSSNATGVENELRFCANNRLPVSENMSGPAIPGIRPIYPYCPYSPYASPQGSPRTNRRRPLRESRRVSIDSRQGALQLNQYKLLNNIGQGSYGIVKLAYNEEDETHYAMKILSKKKLMKKAGIFGRIAPRRKGVTDPLAKVYREIALLKKLDHPNVVKLVEVLDDPDEDNLYLVFELVQKGEVLQLPTDKPLDEETARRHFRDVVMGVEYLHYQRIVHRDIKPSNLLVDGEGRVKVADLGVSAELRAAGELLTGSAGTPAFAAPETTSPGAQYSGTPCDVWSMGITLYSLVTGKVPWDGAGSIIGVQSAVRSEPLRFPDSPCLTEDLRDLVSRMLLKDPKRRINLSEIKKHPWLTNKGEEPLPDEADNCRLPVTVTDEEVARVVTRVPKLDTLILIKTMLKQHSFQNPFLPRRTVRSGVGDAGMSGASLKQQTSSDTTDSSTELLPTMETLKSKTEQFHKAGRSNSAPDSYEWQINGKQISSDSLLPPVTEFSGQEQPEVEKR